MLVSRPLSAVLLLAGVLGVGQSPPEVRPARLLWRAETQPCSLTRPAVAGELVYVGACDGTFRALDRTTGRPAWSFHQTAEQGDGGFKGEPLVHRDAVLAGTEAVSAGSRGALYRFDRNTGKVAWLMQGNVVSPTVVDIDVCAAYATDAGQWVCIDIDSGRPVWRFRPAGARRVGPTNGATDGVTLCVLGLDGSVYGLEGATGKRQWNAVTPSPVSTPLFMYKDVLYFGTLAHGLYGLDPADGRRLVNVRLPVSVDGTYAMASRGEEDFEYAYGLDRAKRRVRLLAFRDEFESVLWSQTSDAAYSSAGPEGSGTWVVAGTRLGEIVAYDAKRGTVAWRSRVDGPVDQLVADESRLYVTVTAGAVYVVDLRQK